MVRLRSAFSTRLGLACVAGLAVVPGLIHFTPSSDGDGPLDRLDPRAVPADLRPADPPRELVGVVGRLGGPQTEQVYSAALSPDGAWLAVGTRGGAVRLHEVPSLACRWVRDAHDGQESAVAFAPDGRTLVSGGTDGRVRRWTRDGEPLPGSIQASDGPVLALAVAPDGRTLAVGSPLGVRLWRLDRDGARPIAAVPALPLPVHALAFSPDGRRLASGWGDQTVRLWRVGDDRPELDVVLEGHVGRVRAVAFSADGSRVAALDSEGRAITWGGGSQLDSWQVFCPICLSGQFAPDGRHLLTVHGNGTAWVMRLPFQWAAR